MCPQLYNLEYQKYPDYQMMEQTVGLPLEQQGRQNQEGSSRLLLSYLWGRRVP